MTIQETPQDEGPDLLIPPLRFHVIAPNLYCGSYPRPRNKRFLEGLGLKTILSVTPSPIGGYSDEVKEKSKEKDKGKGKDKTRDEGNNKAEGNKEDKKDKKAKENMDLAVLDKWLLEFAAEQNIDLVHIPSASASDKSKKKRGVPLEYDVARLACQYMINQDISPIYLHCMNGSQVSCLLIACLRKLSFWSMAAISDEFLRYCDMEPADANFVEGFRAEIDVPENTVPWIWQGLSKTGVVKHHPTIKFHDNQKQESLGDAVRFYPRD